MRVQPWADVASLECVVVDETGGILLVFLGRRKVAGVDLGRELIAEGMVGQSRGYLAMLNPDIELLAGGLTAGNLRRRGFAMALKKLVDRFTKSTEDSDREQLAAFCDDLRRHPPRRAPAAGARALRRRDHVGADRAPGRRARARGHDLGRRGSVVAVFLGRRKIAAMSPGRRLEAEGVAVARGPERLVYNPWYRFIAR